MKNNTNLNEEIDRVQNLISSPKMREMRRSALNAGIRGVRPRNAASIILIDLDGPEPRLLMGQRNKNMKFMPGALVFPGGSVDRYDTIVSTADELETDTHRRLHLNIRGKPGKNSANSMAIAAVRELAEETGLLIGEQSEKLPHHKDWQDFKLRGLSPAISSLRLLARAITPPGPSRRFDTWFFTAPIDAVKFTPVNGFAPSGELEALRWITPRDAINENTREITRVILVDLMNRLENDPEFSPQYPVPYYSAVHGVFNRQLLD